eukprot:GEMP01024562.1.p1 GENE.GEMP01024562.1~~GEMP01024562.1.p1  ORF type:complete len:470 (+),score=111.45 GEMP01024562.1:130-1539(+)
MGQNPYVAALRNSNLETWEEWMELSSDGYVKCSLCSMKYADASHLMSEKHKRQIKWWYQEKENMAAKNAHIPGEMDAPPHYEARAQDRRRLPFLEYYGDVAVPKNLRPWHGADIHPGIIAAAAHDMPWHPVNQLHELGFEAEMPEFMDLNDQGLLICTVCKNKQVTKNHLVSEKHKRAVQWWSGLQEAHHRQQYADTADYHDDMHYNGNWAHGDWDNANATNECYSNPWMHDQCHYPHAPHFPPATSSNTAPTWERKPFNSTTCSMGPATSSAEPEYADSTEPEYADTADQYPAPSTAYTDAPPACAASSDAPACSAPSHDASAASSDAPVWVSSPRHATPPSSMDATPTPRERTDNRWPDGDTDDDDEVLDVVVVNTYYDGVEWFTEEMPELGYLIVKKNDVLRVSSKTIEDGESYNRYKSYIFGQHTLARHGGWSGWVPMDIIDFVDERPSSSRDSRPTFVPLEETI